MKLEIKKGSRRLREFRLSYPYAFYLVTTAKAEGASKLDGPGIFAAIVSEISRLEKEGAWEVWALVLMPTHLHMIVRLGRDQDLAGPRVKSMGKTKLPGAYGIRDFMTG